MHLVAIQEPKDLLKRSSRALCALTKPFILNPPQEKDGVPLVGRIVGGLGHALSRGKVLPAIDNGLPRGPREILSDAKDVVRGLRLVQESAPP